MVWFFAAGALVFMASTLDAGTVVRICILAFLSAVCPLLVIPAAAVMFALWLIGEARRDAKVKRDREAAVARRQCQPRAVAPAAARPVAPGGGAPSILDPWLESKLAEMQGTPEFERHLRRGSPL